MAKRTPSTNSGNVLVFPAAASAAGPVTQTVSMDIDIDPSLCSVGDLKAMLARFDDNLLMRIGFFDEGARKPEVYPMTRLVAAIVEDDMLNEAGKAVTVKIPALMFTFDASVMPHEFEGPHTGDLPPSPPEPTGRKRA